MRNNKKWDYLGPEVHLAAFTIDYKQSLLSCEVCRINHINQPKQIDAKSSTRCAIVNFNGANFFVTLWERLLKKDVLLVV